MSEDFFTDFLCYFCISTTVDSGVNRVAHGTWDPTVGYHTAPDGSVVYNPPPERGAPPAQSPLLAMQAPAGNTMNRGQTTQQV